MERTRAKSGHGGEPRNRVSASSFRDERTPWRHEERWPTTLADAVPRGGEPLSQSTRRHLERQLSWDFSKVRVHSGEEASRYAAFFGAAAYTVGDDIVLGNREQRRATDEQRLLLHEATHVVQQGEGGGDRGWLSAAMQVSNQADRAESEARAIAGGSGGHAVTPTQPCVARISPSNPQIVHDAQALTVRRRQLWHLALSPPPSPDPEHKENPQDNRYHAMRCFNRIRQLASTQKLPSGKTEEDYYKILENLLSTPKALTTGGASPDLRGERNALEAEFVFPASDSSAEEDLTKSLRRNQLPGGQRVEVLKRDLTAVYSKTWAAYTVYLYRNPGETEWYRKAHIHARIYLEPARKSGPGAAEDQKVVNQIKHIVQDIENVAAGSASTGVTFDLEFPEKRRGAARFSINSSKWPDSANPWGKATTMVEEIFHSIGLEDVYDYTVHATNAVYSIHTRLELLLEQLGKYRGTDPRWRPDLPSITKGGAAPTDFDYCQVLAPYPGQFRRCVKERGVPPP